MSKKTHAIEIPSVRRRTLARLVSCAMSAALVAGVAAGPAVAYADAHVYANASVTITPQANEGATYDAYKIFDADIDGSNNASHIAWSSDSARTAVLQFLGGLTGNESYAAWLTAKGYTQSDAATNAQNAAEFIAERVAADADDADFGGNPSAKAGGGFADRFARAVAASAIPKATTGANCVVSGTEGYYLIVSTPSSIGADKGGSAPMWVPLGGSLSTITAKEAMPAVTFKVKEDKTGAWGIAADSNTGQDLEFRIQGTVPDNIGAYSLFHDQYVITLPAGMTTAGTTAASADASISSFTVTVGGQDVTSAASLSSSGRVVTVGFANLKAVSGFSVEKGAVVEITYDAHLNADAVIGAAGNATSVVRSYTKDPISLADGSATTQVVKNYGYQAKLVKIDKSNHERLAGAGFYIQAATDQGALGSYVQADGSLGAERHVFETDANGEFSVTGIDEGSYTIVESGAPRGYMVQDANISLEVASTINQATGAVTFQADVTGGEAAEVVGDESTRLLGEDAATCLAVIQAVDEREFTMPLTGLSGNAGMYATALAMGMTGASALYAGSRRKRTDGGNSENDGK